MPTQDELLQIMKNAAINRKRGMMDQVEKASEPEEDVVITIPKKNLRTATLATSEPINDSERILSEILVQLKGMNKLLTQIRNNAMGIPMSLNDGEENGQNT